MAVVVPLLGLLVAGACAIYGARLRYDEHLHAYPRHDPFRREQENEGVLWIASGAALLLMATVLWWVTRG